MANVLVVDDDDHVRRYMSLLLAKSGHCVREAPDGNAAIRALQGAAIDLMITDVAMPGMGGLKLISKVRTRRPTIGILAVSGAGWDGPDRHLRLAKRFGADSILLKPFGPSRFIDTVMSVLGIEGCRSLPAGSG